MMIQKKMSNTSHKAIKEKLSNANKVLLASHIRPDGDAIGSLLGMGLALEAAGKQVTMVLTDGVPANFRYLPGYEKIQRSVSLENEFDLTVSLDASDPERLGAAFGERKVGINIDHHVTNIMFGELNYVDPKSVATCAILAEHLPTWGLPVSSEVATSLLSGIITDTIGFRTSNMNPKALRLTADLMEIGADLPEIYHLSLVNRSFEQINYWGYALEKLEHEDRLAWTSLTLADRKQAGYNGNDDADLNTLLSSISGYDVTVLFVEQSNNHVKISWRAKPGFDVSQLAFSFGGGGHPAAAGADISGNLEEVKTDILTKTKAYLRETYKKTKN